MKIPDQSFAQIQAQLSAGSGKLEQLKRVQSNGKGQQHGKIDQAAKNFEALILGQLMKAMRATVPSDDENSSFGMQLSYELFDENLSETAAGTLGFGSMLKDELSPRTSSVSRADVEKTLAPQSPQKNGASRSTPIHGSPSHHSAIRPREGIFSGDIWPKGMDPVDGITSSEFGWREHPISGTRKFHTGKDIAAPEGTEIRAVQAGTVVFAGRRGGYGNLVELQHEDGSRTRYAHASRIHVRKGDRVDTGEAIADVGSTGASTGAHLHFEVRVDDKPVDPDRYLDQLRRR